MCNAKGIFVNTKRTSTRVSVVALLVVPCTLALAGIAKAETSVAKGDGWEVFVNGRVNAFHSYVRGDSYPVPTFDATGAVLHGVKGGGVEAFADRPPPTDVGGQQLQPGTIEGSRIRSGFLGNVFGFGVRRQLTQGTSLTAYMSMWAPIEAENRRKYLPVPADVREGFIKLEGSWGSLLAGRALTLFNRGATEIDFLYAHGYGLGFVGGGKAIDINGPAAGQIGFGLLANGFASGVAYATPKLAGLQLTVGYYDPANLVGTKFERTKFGRPEAELTLDLPLGSLGKVHLFGNGGWQKLYQPDTRLETQVYGVGYGGRFELGPVRLGLAGHWGKGLGLSFALEPSLATVSESGEELRYFSGYYGQLQLVFGKFSISGGAGVTRVPQLTSDRRDNRDNDGNPATDSANDDADPNTADPVANSYIKQQFGINAGIFYQFTDYFTLGMDYFRADFNWWEGETQVVNFVNTGITMTW
jgi:hypothetical protein